MENTLIKGDKVVVNKLPFIFCQLKNAKELAKKKARLNAISYAQSIKNEDWKPPQTQINNGDIVVFHHPINNSYFVKRCLGKPGDTIVIQNAEIIINQIVFQERNSIKLSYDIWFNNEDSLKNVLEGLNVFPMEYENYIKASRKKVLLTASQRSIIASNIFVDSTVLSSEGPNYSSNKYLWNSDSLNWTKDNFGPIIVPYIGMNIELNKYNYLRYNAIISLIEGSTLEMNFGVCYLNNDKITHYTFLENFYFMLGDNRHYSIDSRYWGFVPEKNIVGKVFAIVFPKNQNKVNWRRLLGNPI